jgi:hypothetical protein
MEERMYTEEEMQQKVREATHPHPHTMVTQPQQTMQQTALARQRPAALPTTIEKHYLSIEGLEDLTLEEDLVLPRWRIVQYSSTIEGKPGQFNNNLTEEVRSMLELIVLKITPSRAMFDANRKLVCMSRNAQVSTSGKSCLGCPYAQWGANNEPPACSRGYTLVCLDPTDDTMCLLGAMRTSVPPVKLYFSGLNHQKTPPFHHLTQFIAEDTPGPKGKYFVLKPKLNGELSPEDKAAAREKYQFLATVHITEVEEPSYDEYGEDEPPESFWQEGPEYEQQQQPF